MRLIPGKALGGLRGLIEDARAGDKKSVDAIAAALQSASSDDGDPIADFLDAYHAELEAAGVGKDFLDEVKAQFAAHAPDGVEMKRKRRKRTATRKSTTKKK